MKIFLVLGHSYVPSIQLHSQHFHFSLKNIKLKSKFVGEKSINNLGFLELKGLDTINAGYKRSQQYPQI